jgi:hypothetical protein
MFIVRIIGLGVKKMEDFKVVILEEVDFSQRKLEHNLNWYSEDGFDGESYSLKDTNK